MIKASKTSQGWKIQLLLDPRNKSLSQSLLKDSLKPLCQTLRQAMDSLWREESDYGYHPSSHQIYCFRWQQVS